MAYNVLIVDDSATTRTIVAKALRHSGISLGEVFNASDGVEALELLKHEWVDIVFADLNMPRMSGVEMVEHMADSDLLATIPVVIVSTEGRQERIDALLNRGVAAFLRKPFTPEQVGETARKLLGDANEGVPVDALEEAFFGAVEGFAMMVAEPLQVVPEPPMVAVVARMRVVGPGTTGEVAIAVPDSACGMIAEMATGESHSDTPCDALAELLNVTAGHLVDSLPGGPFVLEPPTSATTAGATAWDEVTRMSVSLAFDLEGMPLLLGAEISERWS